MSGVPIKRILFDPDFVVEAPFDEIVSATDWKRAGFEPLVTVLFDGSTVDDGLGGKGAEFKKEGGRIDEFDAKSAGIKRFDADAVRVFVFAKVIILGSFDIEEVSHIVGRSCGIQDAKPAPDEIFGGDGIAVGPKGVGTDVECINLLIFGNLPTVGDARFSLSSDGVETGEAFEDGEDDSFVRLADHGGGVKRFWFLAIDDPKVCFFFAKLTAGGGEQYKHE